MKNAFEIVKENLVNPFFERSKGFIGVEIELCLLPPDEKVSLREAGAAFLQHLIDNYGFCEAVRGSDNYLTRVDSAEKDSISFDYHYGELEFSLAKSKNIFEFEKRFNNYVSIAKIFYDKYNVIICGVGSLYGKGGTPEFTKDPFYNTIRSYITQRTNYKDPSMCFTNMFSVQTHIDIGADELLTAFNLFNKLDFARAALFSNSPASDTDGTQIYCARDIMWDNSGLPNTGIFDADFTSLDELAESYANLKIFVRARPSGLEHFNPVLLKHYFDREDSEETDIAFFRSFQRVVLNSYHVLEVRGDCTQPVNESFISVAFNTGLAYNLEKACTAANRFFEKNKITQTYSQLRKMAIQNKYCVSDKILSEFLVQLTDISAQGLESRGYGEENLLRPLYERAQKLENPAKKAVALKAAGCNVFKIAQEFSV